MNPVMYVRDCSDYSIDKCTRVGGKPCDQSCRLKGLPTLQHAVHVAK